MNCYGNGIITMALCSISWCERFKSLRMGYAHATTVECIRKWSDHGSVKQLQWLLCQSVRELVITGCGVLASPMDLWTHLPSPSSLYIWKISCVSDNMSNIYDFSAFIYTCRWDVACGWWLWVFICYFPDLQTLMSVLLTTEAVIMTAPTPQAATYASAIQDISCR